MCESSLCKSGSCKRDPCESCLCKNGQISVRVVHAGVVRARTSNFVSVVRVRAVHESGLCENGPCESCPREWSVKSCQSSPRKWSMGEWAICVEAVRV